MKMTRSTAVAAVAAATLAATGLTYVASASGPVSQAAPSVQQAAPSADGAGGGAGAGAGAGAKGNGNEGKGNEGKGNEGRYEGREEGREFEHRHHEEGRIHINERTYSAHSDGCITVVSGLGARTLNIRNDSHSTVEVFRGAVCDNGAPIATVGPHSTSDGVKPGPTESVEVDDGVVGSFRVVHHHHGEERRGGERHGDDRR
ncbi:hypothetical protein [Kitasatospora aureofaciens]|uniref:hypothetical protein n=1 Tax=Kitasatospora aureofaciens TaxID=1894 RepID=UPI001C485EC4|nr:hypothetical protein [Kitasatospora aureofaciens]MBV6702131.1 hypothetical protein [Kitasatospora aureofaciens]